MNYTAYTAREANYAGAVGGRPMSRWTAAAIHLGISALIAIAVVVTLYWVWYPPPYFELMGGSTLFKVIVGCDVMIGPLLTLIVFRADKPSLRFDLTTIALLQMAALGYGLYTMYEARPVFTVYAVDRFETVSANEIKPRNLAEGQGPHFNTLPLTGPQVVGGKLPTDNNERNKLLFGEYGGDLSALPRFYVPYDEIKPEVVKRARPIEMLEKLNTERRAEIEERIKRLGRSRDDVTFVPMAGRARDMAALLDRRTGDLLDVIDVKPW